MATLEAKPQSGGTRYVFHCEGCGHGHMFVVRDDDKHPSWTFNGDLDRPTFNPSLLNTVPDQGIVCHLYLRDGQIQYLADCTHHMAGQTVPLPEMDD